MFGAGMGIPNGNSNLYRGVTNFGHSSRNLYVASGKYFLTRAIYIENQSGDAIFRRH